MQLRSILFFAVLLPAWGTTYYVSLTGSDSNSGSAGSPFRHVSKGAAAARHPGDTVIVMDGTYDNEGVVAPNFVVNLQNSGAPGFPISFVAQDRGQVILDAGNTWTGTTCNGASSYFDLGNVAYVVIQGFVIQHACDQGLMSNGYAHDITLRWNEICYIANRTVTDQNGRDGIYMNNNQYNFTFDGNSFHDIGRTDGTEYLHFDHGIYSKGINLTVINNVFYNMNRGYSIQIANGASNWLIANNTFAFGDANGQAGQIEFWETNAYITIENNIFYEPNIAAMDMYEANISNTTFSNNLVYGVNNIMPVMPSGITVGSNMIGANPMFVNASNPPYDFELQANSPAIGSGVTIAPLLSDYTGRPRLTRASDIGAYASRPDSQPARHD
jgi:hypothetical protein